MLTVADLMSESVICVTANDNLAHAYELMSDRHIRHLPVVTADGDLDGLLTHRDLMRSSMFLTSEALPISAEMQFLKATKVSECMTHSPETISPDTALADAAAILLENKFGCLPVVSGSNLVGILTESDFVRHVLDQESDLT